MAFTEEKEEKYFLIYYIKHTAQRLDTNNKPNMCLKSKDFALFHSNNMLGSAQWSLLHHHSYTVHFNDIAIVEKDAFLQMYIYCSKAYSLSFQIVASAYVPHFLTVCIIFE